MTTNLTNNFDNIGALKDLQKKTDNEKSCSYYLTGRPQSEVIEYLILPLAKQFMKVICFLLFSCPIASTLPSSSLK